jgi:hypothetical protein
MKWRYAHTRDFVTSDCCAIFTSKITLTPIGTGGRWINAFALGHVVLRHHYRVTSNDGLDWIAKIQWWLAIQWWNTTTS